MLQKHRRSNMNRIIYSATTHNISRMYINQNFTLIFAAFLELQHFVALPPGLV